ncbi:MAG: membrane integrity-associated transporter subunit PqiC [Deltaproteobacteria bacterium]|nr:membrane integrity-associated transporter subunit PqiC [Deltaproteobacteria bacterium]
MKRRLVFLVMIILPLMFAACATTPPADFYLLTPLARLKAPVAAPGERSALSLGIGPINVPKYLDRPQIVTRANRNTLRLAEFNRWAEQLKNNITQVMAENLSILLATNQVETFPWQRQRPIDYQVVMNIMQFERDPAGNARLLVRWRLMNGEGKQVLKGRKSLITVKPKGRDYDSLVAALSKTLAAISREIAGAIKSMPILP